jgi:D-alanyl-D-alanine carboxypeptidase (penicillin-binding protein 5/6)
VTSFRRSFSLFFALIVAAFCAPAAQAAQAYVIIDGKSGFVLQERNSKDKRQVGSLTKIATAAVVLDWAEKHNRDLSQKATVPPDAFTGGENLVGFQPGDVIELRDLLYAALIQSDNIAAHTLADHVGRAVAPLVPASGSGSPVATFVGQMNALAKTLGMTRTRFVNPHGFDTNVKPVPHSTAADMARLTRYAMNKAGFRFYVSQKERQISWERGGKTQSYILRNTNELLGQDGVEGVKTGRTARAGDCLILSAQRQAQVIKHGETSATVLPRHLIVVILGSPDRFGEGRQLLGMGWQLHEQWAAAGRQVDPKKVL